MKTLWHSRRTFISTLAILCMTAVGLYKGIDVSMALASVAIGVAGANAFESSRVGSLVSGTKQGSKIAGEDAK